MCTFELGFGFWRFRIKLSDFGFGGSDFAARPPCGPSITERVPYRTIISRGPSLAHQNQAMFRCVLEQAIQKAARRNEGQLLVEARRLAAIPYRTVEDLNALKALVRCLCISA